jgi:hypothetical protein
MVKLVVLFVFTVWAMFGLMLPPVPAEGETVKLVGAFTEKAAVTVLSDAMDTMQIPVPVQAPDQPVKLEPAFAAAVSVTD